MTHIRGGGRFVTALVVVVLIAALSQFSSRAGASPAEEYTGTHFGDGNMPPGCEHESFVNYENNACHHMRTGLNALDSPQVDVLIMVPVVADRRARHARSCARPSRCGKAGIALPRRRWDWTGSAEGMHFHVTVDVVDLRRSDGGEFTTYPIVDPEIVVIATNPVGGVGIGVDPARQFLGETRPVGPARRRAVHRLQNPFDFDAWAGAARLRQPPRERVGTYVEDCGGAGGNICFAINAARSTRLPGSDRRLQPVRPRDPRVRPLPHARPRRRRRRRRVGRWCRRTTSWRTATIRPG